MLIISDFNADSLAGLWSNDSQAPIEAARAAGFGRLTQTLLSQDAEQWSDHSAALVWTRPESVSPTFAKVLAFEESDHEEALSEVDAFCSNLEAASKNVASTYVPTWQIQHEQRGYGPLDRTPQLGVRALLSAMNERLALRISQMQGVYLLDSTAWFARPDAFSTKLWYLAKVPFSPSVFKAGIQDVKAAMQGVAGNARKVVICDLDDTLWGGIVGDLGWEKLRLGGHDAVGEALVDFQKQLKALTRRGIILGIVSKNTESVALEAIDSHPEMVLRSKDFAGWRINWQDKAQNIADLMAELNLGLQSAVFLDDNPVERARVAETLPEVLVPELPRDKMLYGDLLRSLNCFDTPALSKEDRERAAMYNAERERRSAMSGSAGSVTSLDDWLKTLEVRVEAETLRPTNQQRTAQLLNKTNQMNLTTRRMTEAELVAWAGQAGHEVWSFRVSDKFGDSGLTGIASLRIEGESAHIADYILSCRVMGKKVEETIVAHLVARAAELGASTLIARYLETKKNKPCLEFWQRSGFEEMPDGSFTWDLSKPYEQPAAVALEVKGAANDA